MRAVIFRTICLIATITIAATGASAEPDSDQIVNIFLKNCVNLLPGIEKIEENAATQKWKTAPASLLNVSKPEWSWPSVKGWKIDVDGLPPMVLKIPRFEPWTKITAGCELLSIDANPDDIIRSISVILNLGKAVVAKDSDGSTVNIWSYYIGNQKITLSVTDFSRLKLSGANIRATIKK